MIASPKTQGDVVAAAGLRVALRQAFHSDRIATWAAPPSANILSKVNGRGTIRDCEKQSLLSHFFSVLISLGDMLTGAESQNTRAQQESQREQSCGTRNFAVQSKAEHPTILRRCAIVQFAVHITRVAGNTTETDGTTFSHRSERPPGTLCSLPGEDMLSPRCCFLLLHPTAISTMHCRILSHSIGLLHSVTVMCSQIHA